MEHVRMGNKKWSGKLTGEAPRWLCARAGASCGRTTKRLTALSLGTSTPEASHRTYAARACDRTAVCTLSRILEELRMLYALGTGAHGINVSCMRTLVQVLFRVAQGAARYTSTARPARCAC